MLFFTVCHICILQGSKHKITVLLMHKDVLISSIYS